MTRTLEGRVALVAGATRGAGRGIACALGEVGATVYCTGRSVRGRSATAGRPETIDETAELVTARGGRGVASVLRLAFAMAEELRERRITALSLTPGFLRSEAMLDHFGVTETTWRDAVSKDPHFAMSETPTYIGRAIVALASDPDVFRRTGRAFDTGALARDYGFADVDATRPDWASYFRRTFPERFVFEYP